MKKALILGCSHSVGSEMFKEPGLEFDNWVAQDNYNLLHCYPAQIARKMGYNPINRGIAGSSNDAVFRLFTEEILTPDDIVIVCWTGANRTEIYNNQWLQLCPGGPIPEEIGPDYFKQWVLYSATDQVGKLNKIKNILALNALAHAQGVRVINIDSFWPIPDIKWPESISWPVVDDFMAWCLQHQFPHTAELHFFKSAHDSFAEHVLEKLVD